MTQTEIEEKLCKKLIINHLRKQAKVQDSYFNYSKIK